MASILSRAALKRRQFEVDVQRVLEEDFVSNKRPRISTTAVNSVGSNQSTFVPTQQQQASKCVPLSPIPQQPNEDLQLQQPRQWKQIGPYQLLTPTEENASVYTAVDTRKTNGRPVICRRLDRSKYQHMMQLAYRLSSGPDAVSIHEEEENEDAYQQIFPAGFEIINGDDGYFYYFEPKDFGSLHAYVVERKRLSEVESLAYFRQVVHLLMYCHRHGIVLRDLKLRKFVFSDAERQRIRLDGIDELLVCPEKEDPEDDMITDRHGCPAYVGPEILDLSNKAYSGRAADIWSLGVLLFVMLYGRYPFYDTTPARLFAKIRHAQLYMADDIGVSMGTRTMIRCLLRREPSERPSAMEILAHPWLQSEGRVKNVTTTKQRPTGAYVVRNRPTLAERDDDQLVPCVGNGMQFNSNNNEAANGKQRRRPVVSNEIIVPNH